MATHEARASWGEKLSAYLRANDEQSLSAIGKRKLLKPRILIQGGLGGKRSQDRAHSSIEDLRSVMSNRDNNSFSNSISGASESVPTFLARIQHEHRVRLQQMRTVQTLFFADVQMEGEEESYDGIIDNEDEGTATAERKYGREDEVEDGDEDGVLRASLNSSVGGGGGGGEGEGTSSLSFARSQAQRRNSLQRMLTKALSTHKRGVSFAESKINESTSDRLDEMLGIGDIDGITQQIYSFDCF